MKFFRRRQRQIEQPPTQKKHQTSHCRYRDFNWKPDKIAEAILTWRYWPGFSGETCSDCHKTANVLAHHGWFCVCGAFNLQSHSFHQMPHLEPQLGPNRRILDATRKQLTYPPYCFREFERTIPGVGVVTDKVPFVFVRRRKPGDRRWRIVLEDKNGIIHHPEGYFYHHEGSQEEIDRVVRGLTPWPQHRGYALHAEAA